MWAFSCVNQHCCVCPPWERLGCAWSRLAFWVLEASQLLYEVLGQSFAPLPGTHVLSLMWYIALCRGNWEDEGEDDEPAMVVVNGSSGATSTAAAAAGVYGVLVKDILDAEQQLEVGDRPDHQECQQQK